MSMTIRQAVRNGIAFMEDNLHNDVGVSDVASAAAYSPFYFSRAFSQHAHISVYDYLLRRKVSEAYKELFHRKGKIIDLACKYGFQSHEVFTRAFRKMFGQNPSEVAVYQPLAVFEAYDDAYLDFLYGLRVQVMDAPAATCRFAVRRAAPLAELNGAGDTLVLLSRQHPYCCEGILVGEAHAEGAEGPVCDLCGLRRVTRVCHQDARSVLRYYMDFLYVPTMGQGSYLLMATGEGGIDVSAPAAPAGMLSV